MRQNIPYHPTGEKFKPQHSAQIHSSLSAAAPEFVFSGSLDGHMDVPPGMDQKSVMTPITPALTSDQIHRIIESGIYSVDDCDKFEQYLNKQINGKVKPDFEANKHLLKLYRLHPSYVQEHTVILTLLLAISSLPQNHFVQSTQLLTPRINRSESIFSLVKLGRNLELGLFQEFWKDVKDKHISSLISQYPNFIEGVRELFPTNYDTDISTLIAQSHKSISIEHFHALLNLDPKLSSLWITSHSDWKIVEGLIYPPENQDIKQNKQVSSKSSVVNRLLDN